MVQAKNYETLFALKKETTWGTGVTPDVTVPVTSCKISANIDPFIDNGFRGVPAADFGVYQGGGHGEVSLEGLVYADRFGHVLMGLFGTDNVTGAGDPYTHEFKSTINVPSYTFEDTIITGANGGQRATGGMITSCNVSFDSATGVLTYQASAISKIPSKVTPATPTLGTVLTAFPGWTGTVTSTGFSCKVKSGSINIARENEVVHTLCNTKDPAAVNLGPLTMEGSLDVILEDLADFDRYLANTQQSMSISFSLGTPARTITFLMSVCSFIMTPWEADRGSIGVLSKVGFRGLYNDTDDGPGTVSLGNNRASAY